MKRRRQPRDLEKYDTAEDVALALERLAHNVRVKGGLMKFVITLSFWNPDWLTSTSRPFIVTQVTYSNLRNQKHPDAVTVSDDD